MKRAIIIGASSGIGRELAKVLSDEGYTVGLTGRRVELLTSLKEELSTPAFIRRMDISQTSEALQQLEKLIEEMGGVDLVVISAGVGFINTEFDWNKEKATIDTNVTGFAAMANVALKYFIEQSSGHLVGISSVAALRGGGATPAYNASKAFVSNYLEGLRQKVGKLNLPIIVTDIQPGLVDTAMAQGEGLFWVAPPDESCTANLQGNQAPKKARLYNQTMARDSVVAEVGARLFLQQTLIPSANAISLIPVMPQVQLREYYRTPQYGSFYEYLHKERWPVAGCGLTTRSDKAAAMERRQTAHQDCSQIILFLQLECYSRAAAELRGYALAIAWLKVEAFPIWIDS